MTVATDRSPTPHAAARPRSRPGSLVSPVTRHALVLLAAAVVGYYLGSSVAIAEQPTLWLAATGGVGLVAGLVSGGWLGLPFLLAGLFVGRLIELQLRTGAGPLPAEALISDGPLYLAAIGAAVAGYVVMVFLLEIVRRRR